MLKEGIGQFACYPLPSIRFATAREETPTVHGVINSAWGGSGNSETVQA